MAVFSGTYLNEDVEFLVKLIDKKLISIEEKEALIQSGLAHYSELLSEESAPTKAHLAIFEQAVKSSANRLAKEVLMLAKFIATQFKNQEIVLVSLMRAGVPLGILLHRALKDMGQQSYHYAVSIVRDRGIDDKAMRLIETRHAKQNIIFVDGWTGKGAIANQLATSLAQREGYSEKTRLLALADPCGVAWMSASNEDWLIPFSILNSTVSGLISRSIWSFDDYHGCVLCDGLRAYDCSNDFVNTIHAVQKSMDLTQIPPIQSSDETKQELRLLSSKVINFIQQTFSVNEINQIKPGIAEATRAVLRRVPDYILVKNKNDPDVKLLVMLAKQKRICIDEAGALLGRYKAMTIIKKVC